VYSCEKSSDISLVGKWLGPKVVEKSKISGLSGKAKVVPSVANHILE
jgi:hypothetical protein